MARVAETAFGALGEEAGSGSMLSVVEGLLCKSLSQHLLDSWLVLSCCSYGILINDQK